jgi:hypothetical protein
VPVILRRCKKPKTRDQIREERRYDFQHLWDEARAAGKRRKLRMEELVTRYNKKEESEKEKIREFKMGLDKKLEKEQDEIVKNAMTLWLKLQRGSEEKARGKDSKSQASKFFDDGQQMTEESSTVRDQHSNGALALVSDGELVGGSANSVERETTDVGDENENTTALGFTENGLKPITKQEVNLLESDKQDDGPRGKGRGREMIEDDSDKKDQLKSEYLKLRQRVSHEKTMVEMWMKEQKTQAKHSDFTKGLPDAIENDKKEDEIFLDDADKIEPDMRQAVKDIIKKLEHVEGKEGLKAIQEVKTLMASLSSMLEDSGENFEKKKDEDDDEKWYYTFLGECYIHGRMDGEAMALFNKIIRASVNINDNEDSMVT